MRLLVYPVHSSIEGVIKAPPSKSYTHRVLFASLLACGESLILNPLLARDTIASINAIKKMGAEIKWLKQALRVKGVCSEITNPHWIDCKGSGTTIRIATAVSSLLKEYVLLYGDETLNNRPMYPLLKALSSVGVESISRNGYPPIVIRGPIRKSSEVIVDGSISSQFITALLMISPIANLRIRVIGEIVSRPYIDITIRVLESFGAKIRRDGYRFYESQGSGLRASIFEIPGDYSSAAFLLALGAIKGRIKVIGLNSRDVQGDKIIVDILKNMGAHVHVGADYVEVESSGILEGVEVNLKDTPDLAPVVAALAAYANGTTVIRGVKHLAFKESNRLHTITKVLRFFGVYAKYSEDYLVIKGGNIKGAVISTFNDHRIAMMAIIVALGGQGIAEIRGVERISDSYPFFIKNLRELGVRVEVIND